MRALFSFSLMSSSCLDNLGLLSSLGRCWLLSQERRTMGEMIPSGTLPKRSKVYLALPMSSLMSAPPYETMPLLF